jgi:hypothetical protein
VEVRTCRGAEPGRSADGLHVEGEGVGDRSRSFSPLSAHPRERTLIAGDESGARVSSTTSMDVEKELDDILYLSATRYSSLAAVVVLVYDYILCLADEADLIWDGRWNRGKIIYLLNRYVPTVNMLIHIHTFLNHSLSLSLCVEYLPRT